MLPPDAIDLKTGDTISGSGASESAGSGEKSRAKLGVTPLVDIPLPAGRHTLRAVNPEKGIERKIKIHIRPEQTTVKRVRF